METCFIYWIFGNWFLLCFEIQWQCFLQFPTVLKNCVCARAHTCSSVCACAKSLQSYPTLCDSVDCSHPCSSVHGILQARILEWVAMPSYRGSFWLRDHTLSLMTSALVGVFFTTSTTWEALIVLYIFSKVVCFYSNIVVLLWHFKQRVPVTSN